MTRSIVLHGHFYQPPREDPWLEEIALQPTAAPFHDWNERIEHECYRAVAAARVLDREGRIARVINTLAWTSFDFGPTLLAWMERAAPATYAAVLEADRASAARLGGHGNAVAQAYHHAILPLASRRDKVTEVRWGMADFRRRFGRDPEGMWLPESAVDDETLDVLAAEGIRFTILAPHQVEGAPPGGRPGRYRTSSGRSIALFVYDGATSHGIAFGGLLEDAARWTARLTAGITERGPDDLVSVATDGETYGHHHRFGDMALAAVIDSLGNRSDVRVENYASFLARHPATVPVSLVAPSSWSCAHGVERWRSACGCGATSTSPSQAWRAPFRAAMEGLADELHALYAREAAAHFPDVWAARDAYVDAVDQLVPAGVFAGVPVAPRARELLELERNALRLFTSCAWFFDDVARLEPLQVMRYAARAIELAGADGPAMEARMLARLAVAESNDLLAGSARDIYIASARPAFPPYADVAAAHALARSLGIGDVELPLRCCTTHGGEGLVVVHERSTVRDHAFSVTVHLADVPGSLARARESTVDVRSVDEPVSTAQRFAFADLPERARASIATALRRALVNAALGSAERTRLLAGETLAAVLPAAMLRAVQALAVHRTAATAGLVLDLLDLAEEQGVPVPFDVQTAFARVRDELAGPGTVLAAVALRLGFALRTRATGAQAAIV